MIYIYTIESDMTVNYVIDWLNYYNKPYKRVNSNDFFDLFQKDFQGASHRNGIHWFWKWASNYQIGKSNLQCKNNTKKINIALKRECNILFDLYFHNIKNIVNHPNYVNIDKFTQNQVARNCNLKVPLTIVTSSKKELIAFYQKCKKIITKNLEASLDIELNGEIYKAYTSLLDKEVINTLPDFFVPSLFQEYIEKEFEIRAIYVDDNIYACALISENNVLDIRQANQNSHIRIIPYILPSNVVKKIVEFMHKINLQFGSIDLLYTKNQEYVFLEVNPSGQFLGYSVACNYYIEKKIADYLIRQDNEIYRECR